ncbi:MAG: ABC transporter ATP-binding protein [Candidatus Buchananbacteria bacterium]
MDKQTIIKIVDLCKDYVNEGVVTDVLHGITFEIKAGEFVAIMGPSGSGKSTLMHILGFLDSPTTGEYYFDGDDVKKLTDEEMAKVRNQKIGFIFQQFNLLPKTSVYDNVKLPLLYGKYTDIDGRVKKAITAVGLEHRLNYLSNQLSGGEKQRVAIARSLVTDPKVIFADEPTGNLDSKSGKQIMNILNQLNEEGHTIILVTHETYTAEHAKRILKIKDGLMVEDRLVDEQTRKNALAGILK